MYYMIRSYKHDLHWYNMASFESGTPIMTHSYSKLIGFCHHCHLMERLWSLHLAQKSSFLYLIYLCYFLSLQNTEWYHFALTQLDTQPPRQALIYQVSVWADIPEVTEMKYKILISSRNLIPFQISPWTNLTIEEIKFLLVFIFLTWYFYFI